MDLMKKYLNENSKFITIDGTKIHYRDEGEGPVLLLLHGICASLHTWDKWVKELKQYYRIIRFDIPGFGFSGHVNRDEYNPEIGVEFLDKFVNLMDLKHFFLVGNSIGGFISWRYTLRYPKKVDKLILIDPVGYNQSLPWLVSFASHPLISPLARRNMPRFFFNIATRQIFGDRSKLTDEIRDRYYDLVMYNQNKNSYVDFFKAMRKLCRSEDLSKGISEIATPTLLMWGTDDKWVPIKYANLWKKNLKNCKFISYDGVGHTPMEEIPKQTAYDAYKFLSE